jgi:hypothetical protein
MMTYVAREHWLQRRLVLMVIKGGVASDKGEKSKQILHYLYIKRPVCP